MLYRVLAATLLSAACALGAGVTIFAPSSTSEDSGDGVTDAQLAAVGSASTNYTDSVAKTNVGAHAAVTSAAGTSGHVSGFAASVADGLCYLNFGASCTGVVFQMGTTNIYVWKFQP